MGEGYIYFNNITWQASGLLYANMPISIPGNLNGGSYTESCILVYNSANNFVSQATIDIYQTYLRFRIYFGFGSGTYTVAFFIPGIVIKYA